MEVHLGDAGLVTEEDLLGFQQVFVGLAFLWGLQGDKNERSHPQVQHDSCQQGGEGGASHFPPVDTPAPPGSKV